MSLELVLEKIEGSDPLFQFRKKIDKLTYLEDVIKGKIGQYEQNNVVVNEWNLESRYKHLQVYISQINKINSEEDNKRIERCIKHIEKHLKGYLGKVVLREDRELSILNVNNVFNSLKKIKEKYEQRKKIYVVPSFSKLSSFHEISKVEYGVELNTEVNTKVNIKNNVDIEPLSIESDLDKSIPIKSISFKHTQIKNTPIRKIIKKTSIFKRLTKKFASYVIAIAIGTTTLTSTLAQTSTYYQQVQPNKQIVYKQPSIESSFSYIPNFIENQVIDINISSKKLSILEKISDNWKEINSYDITIPINPLPKIKYGDQGTAYGVHSIVSIENSSEWIGPSGTKEYGSTFIRLTPGVSKENPKGFGIGIHGTNKPGSIGTADSKCCFRLAENNLQSLISQVKKGTYVLVR